MSCFEDCFNRVPRITIGDIVWEWLVIGESELGGLVWQDCVWDLVLVWTLISLYRAWGSFRRSFFSVTFVFGGSAF